MIRLLLVLLALCCSHPALAVNPDEMLADSGLEARARHLSTELRCMVCQNQSIDDSNADLARDLRVLVRERLKAGDSDSQVLAYMRARYGDFVLLKPPVERATLLLWLVPPLVLVLIVAFGLGAARWRKIAPPRPLSDPEKERLAEILGEGGK